MCRWVDVFKWSLLFSVISGLSKTKAHLGCVMGTSRTRSSGISNNSGSFPLACSRSGRTSKRPFGAFHPSWMQIWTPKTGCESSFSSSCESRRNQSVHLCELHIGGVSQDLSVRLFVTCVTNQLTVPNSEVMFAICSLRKDGDGRPAKEKENKLQCFEIQFSWSRFSVAWSIMMKKSVGGCETNIKAGDGQLWVNKASPLSLFWSSTQIRFKSQSRCLNC